MPNSVSKKAVRSTVTRNPLLGQLRPLVPTLLIIYIPTLCLLLGLVAVNRLSGIPIAYLTRDPITAITDDAPCYAGCVSNLGILIWCCAAAITTFSGWFVYRHSARTEWALFLIASGLVTAGLLLDDLFLLHEEVLPDHFGMPQIAVYGLYAALALAYLVRFYQTLFRTEYVLLLIAVFLFAASISMDLLPFEDFYVPFIADDFLGRHLVEDGAKLLGIASWSAYFIRIA